MWPDQDGALCWILPYKAFGEFTALVQQLSFQSLRDPCNSVPLPVIIPICGIGIVFFTMAHVIRPRFKQVYLAPGHRGNFLYVGGGYTGWIGVGVNEPLTESYHLERFWHAEVAAAYTLASSGFWPALKLSSRDECLQGCREGKGPASESCKSQKGTALKVSQSWRLVEPSTRCKRIKGWHRKKPPTSSYVRGQTPLFSQKEPLWWHVWFIFQDKRENFLQRERSTSSSVWVTLCSAECLNTSFIVSVS